MQIAGVITQYFDKALHPEKYQTQALSLTPDQSKLLSDFQAYANNHQGSKQFASALADAQKAMLAGDQKAFDAAMTSMNGIQSRKERVAEYQRKKKNRELYEELKKKNPDYSRVEYDEETGGVLAIHKNLASHPNAEESFFEEGLSPDELEMEAFEDLFHSGYVVQACEEEVYYWIGRQKQTYKSLDIILRDERMDIASITKDSYYGWQLY